MPTSQPLRSGNEKLGERVFTYSLPAITTCPGATDACRSTCYATRHRYLSTSVRYALSTNLATLTAAPAQVESDIRRQLAAARTSRPLVRLHPSGDFFAVAYAWLWYRIIRDHPAVQFWVYTRSWRFPRFAAILTKLAALPNLRLFYSIDRDTGLPAAVPESVRLAYLSISPDDTPPHEADLVFRDYAIRGVPQIRANGVLVCPHENGTMGAPHVTCASCRLCIAPLAEKDPRRLKRHADGAKRIRLPVLV